MPKRSRSERKLKENPKILRLIENTTGFQSSRDPTSIQALLLQWLKSARSSLVTKTHKSMRSRWVTWQRKLFWGNRIRWAKMIKRPRNTCRKSSKIGIVSFITMRIGQTRSQRNLRRIWTTSFDKWPSLSVKTDIIEVLGFSCYFTILNKKILIEFERQTNL